MYESSSSHRISKTYRAALGTSAEKMLHTENQAIGIHLSFLLANIHICIHICIEQIRLRS
jgi:hypothetical protein